jgi:uncharacterized protein
VILLRPHAERPHPREPTVAREVVDKLGVTYRYRVPLRRGMAHSTGAGFLSSFLGIGGGIVHVPLLVGVLGFPTHIATATSHFVLVFSGALIRRLLGVALLVLAARLLVSVVA